MTGGVRKGSLALILGRSHPAALRPAALGWKVEAGRLRPADAALLCAALRHTLARVTSPQRWTPPPALRTLLAEYRAVRRGARHARRGRGAGRTRRASRRGR